MQISEVGAFDEILDTAATVFGKKLTEPVKRAYFEALKNLPLSVIRQCAQSHMANLRFFPKPVDLKPRAPASKAPPSDSKFPTLYSPEWWEARVLVLRHTFPQGGCQASRDSLDEATFGEHVTAELLTQAEACYAKAWPWMRIGDPGWQEDPT